MKTTIEISPNVKIQILLSDFDTFPLVLREFIIKSRESPLSDQFLPSHDLRPRLSTEKLRTDSTSISERLATPFQWSFSTLTHAAVNIHIP